MAGAEFPGGEEKRESLRLGRESRSPIAEDMERGRAF